MEHVSYQRASRLIEESELERVSKDLRTFLKPAFHLESCLASTYPIPVGQSRLGGWPDLPLTLAWPQKHDAPMVFLAQLNLREVAASGGTPLLPSHGWLFFFCQSQSLAQGFPTNVWEYIDPYDHQSWRVQFFAGSEGDLRITPPPEVLALQTLLPVCELTFTSALSLPPLESFQIASLHLEKKERQRYRDVLEMFDQAFFEAGDQSYHHHRLLGYPQQLQEDLQLLCQLASLQEKRWSSFDELTKADLWQDAQAWIHLLQLDTDEEAQITWGEYGSLSFWVKPADLTSLNFDDCRVISDSL